MCTLTGSMALCERVCAWGRINVDSGDGLIDAVGVISNAGFVWT